MAHPRIKLADRLTTPEHTAASLGYRMPAEWSPLAAVWVTPPHNQETWPGCFDKAKAQHAAFASALEEFVPVKTPADLNATTNDSWIRDYGPIFVKNAKGELALHDFHFNGWGGKYGGDDNEYQPDDVIPQLVAAEQNRPIWIHDLVLEGGSIEVDGMGTVMTTAQCLLNENRNPGLSQKQIERELHDALGTTHAIWLPGGIIGDDTDGHIDDIARFVNSETVLSIRAPKDHPDAEMLDRNWRALQDARNAKGVKLTVIDLPVPDPIMYDFPQDRFGPGGVNPVPASYANFLIANNAVLVPVFSQPRDDEALRIIDQAMPEHKVVPIRAEFLVVGLGALHCLSMQQPA